MYWIGAIACIIAVVTIEAFAQISDPLKPTPTWYFGEGLKTGEEFTFEICDYVFRTIDSADPCYNVVFRFVALLQDRQEKVWIVSARVDHGEVKDMILRISENTYKIKTDGANIQYAESIERTLGWIRSFANIGRPQILDVGRSWGPAVKPADLVVSKAEFIDVDGKFDRIYLLNYEHSYLHIKDGFPFPLKAVIYRPMSLAVPLFAFQLTNHNHVETCNVNLPIHIGFNMTKISESALVRNSNETPNSIEIHEFAIDELLRFDKNSTIEQLLKEKYADDYKMKIEQALHNFTKFIEIIAEAANTVLENQMNSSNN